MQCILLLKAEERPNIHTNVDHVAFVRLCTALGLIRSVELRPLLKESLTIDSTEKMILNMHLKVVTKKGSYNKSYYEEAAHRSCTSVLSPTDNKEIELYRQLAVDCVLKK